MDPLQGFFCIIFAAWPTCKTIVKAIIEKNNPNLLAVSSVDGKVHP